MLFYEDHCPQTHASLLNSCSSYKTLAVKTRSTPSPPHDHCLSFDIQTFSMPDSPQVAVVHAWLDYAKTIDVDEIEKLTTDSFAVECIDENGTVHKFTKSQIFHHIRQQVKPYHKTIDVCFSSLRYERISDSMGCTRADTQERHHAT